MDGIHDMGGVEGYGPVDYTPEEKATIDHRWQAISGASLFALLRSGRTNIDAHRHRIERLDPTQYLPIGYWGRWLAAAESATVEQGIASQAEIDAALRARGHDPSESEPPGMHPVIALESRDNAPGFLRSIDAAPRYSVGETVHTLEHPPHSGHHRLPRYVRNKVGTVARVYPAFTLPDAVAHNAGEQPTYLYAVAFSALDLWGPGADPAQTCHLDLFETYLNPGARA